MRDVEKLIVVLLLVTAVAIPACSNPEKPASSRDNHPAVAAPSPADAGSVATPSGLRYTDVVTGSGASPVKGKRVKVHYTGRLTDGTRFDSSLDHGQPFVFTLGVGEVIPGWDEGVASMKVGGKRKLIVPPALGYGAAGAGGVIPPDATLLFDVELLDVEK